MNKINYKDEIGMPQSPDALAAKILRFAHTLSAIDRAAYSNIIREMLEYLSDEERQSLVASQPAPVTAKDPWFASTYEPSLLWDDTVKIIERLRHPADEPDEQ